MAKIELKLKKKEEPAAAPGAAPAAGPASPMFAASGGSKGITLELIGTTVHIQEVVIKPKK